MKRIKSKICSFFTKCCLAFFSSGWALALGIALCVLPFVLLLWKCIAIECATFFLTAGVFLVTIYVMCRINESVQIAECHRLYFSKEMNDALKTLGTLKRNNLAGWLSAEISTNPRTPTNNSTAHFPLSFKAQVDRDKEHKKENNARRIVKSYFLLVHTLRFKSTIPISKKTLDTLCDVAGFTLFFEAVEPMEAVINPSYNRDPFFDLMKACGEVYKHQCEINEPLNAPEKK